MCLQKIIDSLIEIQFSSRDKFLIIAETLTRVGIASKLDNTLFQSCHILHKRQKYYIVHFKELYLLDGKESTLTEDDIARRNTIVNLLEKWGLLTIVFPEKSRLPVCDLNKLSIISSKEKRNWKLKAKYSIGNRRK